MKKNKKVLTTILIVIGVLAGGFIYYKLQSHTVKKPLGFFKTSGNNIVAVYAELEEHQGSYREDPTTGTRRYEEGFSVVNGYVVDLVNPDDGSIIQSVRINKKPGEINHSEVMLYHDKLYIILNPSHSDSEDKPLVEIITVSNNTLSTPVDVDLTEYTIKSIQPEGILLTNTYNEAHILGFAAGKIEPAGANPLSDLSGRSKKNDGKIFFFTPNSPGSTRYNLHFMTYNPNGDFYEGPAGYHIYMQLQNLFTMDLSYNPGDGTVGTSAQFVAQYSGKMKKPESLTAITDKTNAPILLNRPKVLSETDSSCFLIAEQDKVEKFYLFDREKLVWTAEIPKKKKDEDKYVLKSDAEGYTITSPHNWIVMLDHEGNQKWKFPKD